MLASAASALAAQGISVDNRSQQKIKVAAPGGGAVIEATTGPVEVAIDSDAQTGIDVRIWWVAKPRELCVLFVPWQRTVVVTGSRTIRCRSQ